MELVDQMKLSKTALKAIVKECLIEILTEGVGNGALAETKQVQQPRPKQQPIQSRPTNELKEHVVNAAGGNKIMEAIFADTAMTSLPNMMRDREHYQPTHGSSVIDQIVENHTPEELFGDVADKWSTLAFGQKKS